MSATTFYNSTNLVGIGTLNAASVSTTLANVIQANIQSMNVSGDSNLSGNLITGNIIMASNLSTNSGQGNVYISANLVVNGNIFSIGGSVGSGSGTSQGVTYVLPSSYSLGSAFATGSAGPGIAGFHINMSLFGAQAIAAVSSFSASSGMLKFTSAGLYSVQCVLVGDQPAAKVGIGSTSSASFPPSVTATSGYVYVYNYPLNSSPTTLVTIPLTIQDTSKWYYLDAYFSTVSGSPSVLLQTAPPSGSASGSNYGTYVQVGPFGNYLTSATGVASALLANCSTSSNLSGSYSSNAYRIALTSSNGWTVNGTSTSLAVTANGNFQVNQAGLYEVNMCLNTVGQTPVQFQVGSLANDTLAPGGSTPYYLYTYAPMYTQDPTTVIQLPLNITNISNVYFVEVSFQGTSTANIALNQTSTFVSIKPIGSYVTPATNPWLQQGTSVYYNSGPVGLGVVPTALTETLTVSGNTSFVGNVTQVTDASGSTYVTGKRTPAGSLAVSSYVTGSVPLTTTTNLIQNYLSNAAAITANTSTGTITRALNLPGTTSSWINFGNQTSTSLANLSTSNLFIEAWVNPSVVGTVNRTILDRSNVSSADFYFFINTSGQLIFQPYQVNGGNFQASNATAMSVGTWYHVAACWRQTSLTGGVASVFVNGGIGTNQTYSGFQMRLTADCNVWIGGDSLSLFSGNVADVRVWSGGIVPTATFASPTTAPFGASQPAYLTGTPTLLMSLQSQYFPGASTSPYGPCLTLPGTVGSYYYEPTVISGSTNWKTYGFTVEGWVNYASLANSNIYYSSAPMPNMITLAQSPTGGGLDWSLGATTTGALGFFFASTSPSNYYALTTPVNSIVTGQWTHIAVQVSLTAMSLYINGVIQTLTAWNFTNTGTTTAANIPTTTPQMQQTGVGVGQYAGNQGANAASARARIVYGSATTTGNVYSMAGFTPSPNLGPVPTGATVAWQLETQYPLPTFPSIQDVTELPQQASSYGSLPTPIGGVTSNVLGPYTGTQLNSIRFDGTGYIDYGNAATSVMTTNIWASNWTIEGWAYFNNFSGASATNVILGRNYQSGQVSYDWLFYVNNLGQLIWRYGNSVGVDTQVTGPTLSLSTWYHVAATYDGARTNVYCSINSSTVTSSAAVVGSMGYNPSYSTNAGFWYNSYITGNLADVRVSNVARYTGSSYTVPTAPFASNDANTLLLLKSLGGQVGTTLEIQGRGLNAVSLGATRSVQSYPPAPMSSYLLDTTSNASVTYGQGKYVASASSEVSGAAWSVFDKNAGTFLFSGYTYSSGLATGAVTTVDVLGNAYAGEWVQIQMPVSVNLSTYAVNATGAAAYSPKSWYILGSRDGVNWTLVHQVVGQGQGYNTTFSASASQSYNYYRMVVNSTNGNNNFAFLEWTLNGTEESLVITNDAKVGVGIANPQRALEVAGDLVVSGTISGGAGMGSFRNRIINGDMRIAQRGTSSTTVGYGCVDRWTTVSSVSGGTVTQSQQTLAASDTPYQLGFRNSLRYTITTPLTGVSYQYQRQSIEGYNVLDLNWGTSFGSPVTISFWFRSNMPTGSTMCGSFSPILSGGVNARFTYNFTLQSSGQWQYVTYTVPPPPNSGAITQTNSTGITVDIMSFYIGNLTSVPGTWETGAAMYNFGSTAAAATPWWQNAGNYIEFTGVQLEKGTVATPFDARPYATELALCQRYYWNFSSAGGVYTGFGSGYTNGTSALIMVPFPVQMRAQPTQNSNSAMTTFVLLSTGASVSPSALTTFTAGLNSSILTFTVAGQTAGQGAILQANNTTGAFVAFGAEL